MVPIDSNIVSNFNECQISKCFVSERKLLTAPHDQMTYQKEVFLVMVMFRVDAKKDSSFREKTMPEKICLLCNIKHWNRTDK